MITGRITRVFRGAKFAYVMILIFILGFIAAQPPWAHADIPRYINYQGKLTDAEDNPVTGDVSITIRIYDAASGGTALWTETQTATVTRGVFSILLGESEVLDSLDFNDPYWYSVEVEDDGEMTPRQRLTTIAYAINADKLDGYDAADFLMTTPGGKMSITGGANEDITLDPTGLGNIVMNIDSTSGDFKITDGTTNWVLVDSETGNVTIAKNLTVNGTIYGTLASTGGDSTFSSIVVTGTSNLQGNISSSTGVVTVADAFTQTGAANQVTFGGNVDANSGLDVTGALTVSGATTLSGALDMNSNIDLDYSGTSAALSVNQQSTGATAQFSGNRVVIGETELTNTNATATGELYVQGDLEVDGTIYGNVSSSGTTSLGDTTLSSLVVSGTSDLQGNVDVGAGIDITGVANFGGGTTYNVDSTGQATLKALDVTETDSSTSGTVTNTIVQPTFQDGGTDSTTTAVTMDIAPTINYTGSSKTGSYTALKITATETSLPTGSNYLIDGYAGSDGTTQVFYVDNSGNASFDGTVTVATPTADTHAVTKAYADNITPATAGGWTDGGTGVYLLTSGDNVGIGTTSTDTYKLNVSGSTNTTSLYIDGILVSSSDLSDGGSIAMLNADSTITGNWVNTDNPWADNEVVDALTISGGTIDNSVIGDTTPVAGTFNALTVNNSAAAPTLTFNDGTATDTLTYDSTQDYPFNFSDKLSVQQIELRGASPSTLTFGTGANKVSLVYDPDTDEIRFTRGTFAHDFRNHVKNGSFESFSAMEGFHEFDPTYTTGTGTFGGTWDTTFGFQGGWDNFAPDDWTYVSGDVFQHAPMFFETGFDRADVQASTFKQDFTEGASAVRLAAIDLVPAKIKQTIKGLKPSNLYSVGIKMRVEAGGYAKVQINGEDGWGDISTALSADLTDTETSQMLVGSVTDFPEAGMVIIGTEKITYNGTNSTENKLLSLGRGAEGTIKATHSSGAAVAIVSSTSTTLSALLAEGETAEISVVSVENFPAHGVIQIGSERIYYAGLDRDNNKFLRLSRSLDSTDAAEHVSGTSVKVALFQPLELDRSSGAATEYAKYEGHFSTDTKGSDVVIILSAVSGVAYFDTVQIVAGGAVPEYTPNTLVDTGDQTVYGSLRIGRASDEKGGILSVDKFVRTRGLELFTDDPGFTGATGGGSTTLGGGGIFPPGPGWNEINYNQPTVVLYVSGTYSSSVAPWRDYKVVIDGDGTSPSSTYSWYYMDDTTSWSYQIGATANIAMPTVSPAFIDGTADGSTTGTAGVNIQFTGSPGVGGDTWYFNASSHDAYQDTSYQDTATYTPGKTRIYVDPDRSSPYFNQMVFEDGATKVSLGDLAGTVTTQPYIGPVTRWSSNYGWLEMSASGYYTVIGSNTNYEIQIETNGTGTTTYPSSDTFKYSTDGGVTWSSEEVITGSDQSVGNGVYVSFWDPDYNGYYLNGQPGDRWTFTAYAGGTGTAKVESLNGKTGAVTLQGDSNISVGSIGDQIISLSFTGALDGDITNELNTAMSWNNATNTISVTDPGGDNSAVITGFLESVNASLPLSGLGTQASALTIAAASSTQNGYLSSTDWSTFDSKLASEVDPNAILKSPAAAQTIQPTQDVVPLTIKGRASGSANVLSIYDAGATPAEKIYVDSSGHMYLSDSTSATDSDGILYLGRDASSSHYIMWDDDYAVTDLDGNTTTGWFYTDEGMSMKHLELRGASPATITFGSGVTAKELQFDPTTQEFSFTGGKLKQAFQNLIRNGSFESYRPSGWENHNTTWGTNMDMVDNSSVAKFGSKYLRVLDDSGGVDGVARGMKYRVSMEDRFKGENLTMSVWARAASETAAASIGYSYTSDATDALKVKDISLTTTWQNFSWTFPDAVSDSADLIIYIYLYGAGGDNPDSDGVSTSVGQASNSVYIFFDGITLVQGKLALDYGPTPILDTGNQIIYGNLAIGADSDPTGGSSPTLVFGEPESSFYYDGYGGWSMESGQIRYEQLGGYNSGRFMFNKPIRIYPAYLTGWGAGFYLGESGTVNFAENRTDAYIQGNLEVDGTIYGNLTGSVTGNITGDADTVDSIHASASPEANKLLALNASSKFPASAIPSDLTITSTNAGSFAPTTDVVTLTVKQTSASTPSSDIFNVTDSGGTTKYIQVDSSGDVTINGSLAAASVVFDNSTLNAEQWITSSGDIRLGPAGLNILPSADGTIDLGLGAAIVPRTNATRDGGTGTLTLSTSGTYTAYVEDTMTYRIILDGAGNVGVATYKWERVAGSLNNIATGVATSGSAAELENGLSIAFGGTGGLVGDYWDITVTKNTGYKNVFANTITTDDIRTPAIHAENSGGTVVLTGNFEITGDFTTLGTQTIVGGTTYDGAQIIDVTAAEAFLVRQDGDTADVFVVDTTNQLVGIKKTPAAGVELDVSGDGAFSGSLTSVGLNAGSGLITTSGNITTTSTGVMTSAGLLTASSGISVSGGDIAITDTSNIVLNTNKITLYGLSGNATMAGTLTQLRSIGLTPDYDNATLRGDGEDNFGTLTLKYGSSHNYYEWTTNEPTVQDYDIVVRYRLPDGFSSFDTTAPIKLWNDLSAAPNASTVVNVQLIDTDGSSVLPISSATGTYASDRLTINQSSSWIETTITIDNSAAALDSTDAGKYITLIIKLCAYQGDTVDVGELTLKGNW